MDIRQRLMVAFDMEYREHLATMRRLSKPGAAPGDLAEVFRCSHSLKGAARAVEHAAVEAVAHRLESLLELIQAKALALDEPVSRAIQAALDAIEDVADNPDASAEGLPALQELARLIDGAAPAVAWPPSSQALPARSGLPPVQAEAASPPPTVPPPPPAVPPPAPAEKPVRQETIRVQAQHLDHLMVTGGRLSAQVAEQADLDRQLRALQQDMAALQRGWERSRKEGRRRDVLSMPDIERSDSPLKTIDKDIMLLGRRLGQFVRAQASSSWKLRRLADQLQDDVRQVRLVPAEEIFAGFGRMVRDLAREQGKQVELSVAGMEIEADRMILQALKDPMMHVLRNVVAHGAERPDERVRAGKPPAVSLSVTLALEGTRVRLIVADDGRGLDFQQIRAAAVRHGVMSAAAAEEAPEPELARLLLRAGFSTNLSVDRLAGRGVGLSVLQDTVARLQGDVEIGANHPHGMRLEILLPMSVVRSDLLLVSCQDQLYALPSQAIERVLRIRVAEIEMVEGHPVLRVADGVLSLVVLSTLLGMEDAALADREGYCAVMVLRTGRRRLAVLVDALVEMRQGAIQEPPDGCDPAVIGTLTLEGRPILVLSPAVLADGRPMMGKLVLAKAVPAKVEPPSILVVDDSITTRTLEKSILEAEGFRVRLAVDGIDALESLRREPADLVISDVQMPRLDGFGLLRALKGDPAFASIPVIMVTSRDSVDEVQRGMELGADAYIVKQGFEQQALLETILQFVEPPARPS